MTADQCLSPIIPITTAATVRPERALGLAARPVPAHLVLGAGRDAQWALQGALGRAQRFVYIRSRLH